MLQSLRSNRDRSNQSDEQNHAPADTIKTNIPARLDALPFGPGCTKICETR